MPKAQPPQPKAAEPDWLADKPAEEVEEAPDDPRMGVPEGWDMIHTLMSRILADVGPVAKDQVNVLQKYNFRGVDQVVNAVNAAFKRHRVYVRSEVVEAVFRETLTTTQKATREVTGKIRFIFTAPDGSQTESEVLTESLDTGDKGGPKAMSVALRICLLQMLLLPTDEPTTDHDGHYLTRDGVGPMSKSTARIARHTLGVGSLADIAHFLVPLLLEHAAWDKPLSDAEGDVTWSTAVALTLAAKIRELPSHVEIAIAKGTLDGANLLTLKTDGGTMVEHLRRRWVELRDLYANTLNHVTGRVLAAQGRDELRIAIGCGEAAVEAGSLLADDLAKVIELADERAPKLPETAPHEEENSPEGDAESEAIRGAIEAGARVLSEEREAADPGYLEDAAAEALTDDELAAAANGTPIESDPEDYGFRATRDSAAFLTFKTRAINAPVAGAGENPMIREDIVYREIVDLLTGEHSHDPASNYGTDGFTLVDDAIKAAHRREQTIGDEARAKLDKLLSDHRALAGA